MSAQINADIAVVGAGLVGLTAAIVFAQQGKSVVLLDAKKSAFKPKKAWDERVYALTANTVNWLKTLHIWSVVDKARVNEIAEMRLWNKSGDNLALQDVDANLANLGVIIENQNLQHALWQQIEALGVTVISGQACISLHNNTNNIVLGLDDGSCVSTKLLLATDGVDSWVRVQVGVAVKQKDFNQTAIVANFVADKPHSNVARQWFAPHETLAMLPLPQQMVSMVWALSTKRAAELVTLSNNALAEKVNEFAQTELGNVKLVGKVLHFDLKQQTANQLIANRVVIMGDAAHQIHPMAGQGVNLGLRDVMQLQQLLTNTHSMQDIGEYGFLRKYARARQADISKMNVLTSGLDNIFASENKSLQIILGWGFRQFNKQAAIKKLLIQQAA